MSRPRLRNRPEIKAVVFDVDGTATDPKDPNKLAPQLIASLEAAVAAGWKVVPLTGRTDGGVYDAKTGAPIFDGSDVFTQVFSESGAVFRDMEKGTKIFRAPQLDKRAISEMTKLFLEIRGGVPITAGDITEEDPFWSGATCVSSTTKHESLMTETLERYGYTVIGETDPLAIHDFDDKATRDAKHERLQAMLRAEGKSAKRVLQVSYNHKWIMYSGYGINKTEAFEWLLEYLGIDRSHTMAAGDGENDLFIRVAGYPVVPANAKPRIVDVAGRVINRQAGEALAHAIDETLHTGTPELRAHDTMDERQLDAFLSQTRVFDERARADYTAIADALLTVNFSVKRQVIVEQRRAHRVAANSPEAGTYRYRVVRDPGDGRSNRVEVYAADLASAEDWAVRVGMHNPERFEIQRTMGRNRWIAVRSYARRTDGVWHPRNRVAERSGRNVAGRDLCA
jgi:HAD superfamily hydrolase (TIGR01484 family)